MIPAMDFWQFAQLCTFVGSIVWAVGKVKATGDNLGDKIASLAKSVDKLNETTDHHETRISRLEGAK